MQRCQVWQARIRLSSRSIPIHRTREHSLDVQCHLESSPRPCRHRPCLPLTFPDRPRQAAAGSSREMDRLRIPCCTSRYYRHSSLPSHRVQDKWPVMAVLRLCRLPRTLCLRDISRLRRRRRRRPCFHSIRYLRFLPSIPFDPACIVVVVRCCRTGIARSPSRACQSLPTLPTIQMLRTCSPQSRWPRCLRSPLYRILMYAPPNRLRVKLTL